MGWGIGLPFVRGPVKGHSGVVSLDSSNELGMTVTIDLPVDCRPFI